MTRIAAFVVLWIGIIFGTLFPDIDQSVDFLLHRSILTHGLLLPLALFAVVNGTDSRVGRWFVIGVCVSIGVHLAFDLFPRAWTGFALISIPYFGWTPELFSRIWIGVSMVTCLFLAMTLVRSYTGAITLMVSLIAATGVAIGTAIDAGDSVWRPVVIIIATAFVTAVWVRRGRRAARAASRSTPG